MNVFTRERTGGQIDVLVSGEVLVNGNTARVIEAVREPTLDPERDDLVEIRFADTGLPVVALNGELFGLLDIRDNVLVDVDTRIDTISATIIEQINRIHSQGNGVTLLSGTVTSSTALTSGVATLDSSGLPFALTSGGFDVTIVDAAGAFVSTTNIAVDPTTDSLTDIATLITGVTELTATVTANNELEITAAPGSQFLFTSDTTGFLAATGTNVLFTGDDAQTISGQSHDPREPEPAVLGDSTRTP